MPPKVISHSFRGKHWSGPNAYSLESIYWLCPIGMSTTCNRKGVTCSPPGISSSEGKGRGPPHSPSQWGSRPGSFYFYQHSWELTKCLTDRNGTPTTLIVTPRGRHCFTDWGEGRSLKLQNLVENFILLLFKPIYPPGFGCLPRHFSCLNDICVCVCVYICTHTHTHIYTLNTYM